MGILEKGRVLPLVRIIALCLAGMFLAGADFFEDSSRIDFFGQDKAIPAEESVTRKPDGSSFNDKSRNTEPKEPILPEVRDVIRRVEKAIEEDSSNKKESCSTCGSPATNTNKEDASLEENVIYYFFSPGCPYCSEATRLVDKFYRRNNGRVRVEGIMVADPGSAIRYYQELINGYGDFNDAPQYPISVSYTRAREMGVKEVPTLILAVNGHTCRAAGRIDPERFYRECLGQKGGEER